METNTYLMSDSQALGVRVPEINNLGTGRCWGSHPQEVRIPKHTATQWDQELGWLAGQWLRDPGEEPPRAVGGLKGLDYPEDSSPALAIEGRKNSLHAAEGDYRNSMGKRGETPWNRQSLIKRAEEKVPQSPRCVTREPRKALLMQPVR